MDNPDLITINFTDLIGVGGSLTFYDNRLLTHISANSVQRIDGRLYVVANHALPSFHLPVLQYVGGALTIGTHQLLVNISACKLVGVGDRPWITSTVLLVIDFPILSEIGGDFDVTGNAMLIDTSASSLIKSGGVSISQTTLPWLVFACLH